MIGDFQAGVDRIDLSAFGLTSFAQLQTRFIQNGATGAINLQNGDLVVLLNVTMASLTAADFILSGGYCCSYRCLFSSTDRYIRSAGSLVW